MSLERGSGHFRGHQGPSSAEPASSGGSEQPSSTLEWRWQCEQAESSWGQTQMLTMTSAEVSKKSFLYVHQSLGLCSAVLKSMVILGFVLIFSHGSENVQVKVAVRCVGLKWRPTQMGRKNELLTLYLALIHPPSSSQQSLLLQICTITITRRFSSMCKIKIINSCFAVGLP